MTAQPHSTARFLKWTAIVVATAACAIAMVQQITPGDISKAEKWFDSMCGRAQERGDKTEASVMPVMLLKVPGERSLNHHGSWGSPGGSVIVSSFWDRAYRISIRVYDTAGRRLIETLTTGESPAWWTPVGEMPNGDIVLVGGGGPSGPIRGVLEPKAGRQVRDVQKLSAFAGTSVRYGVWCSWPKTADGKTGFCSQDQAVTVFSFLNGSDHQELNVPGLAQVLAVNSQSKRLAVSCAETTGTTETAPTNSEATLLKVVNYETGSVEGTVAAMQKGRFAPGGFSPDGNALTCFAIGEKREGLFLCSKVGREWSTEELPLTEEMIWTRSHAFTPDGKHLACVSVTRETGKVYLMLWSVEDARLVRQVLIRGFEYVQELLFMGSNLDLYLIDNDGSLLEISGFGKESWS